MGTCVRIGRVVHPYTLPWCVLDHAPHPHTLHPRPSHRLPHTISPVPYYHCLHSALYCPQLSLGISFTCSPSSTALQFLDPSQTAGGKQPYLFTQCQAIHARSLVPCQVRLVLRVEKEVCWGGGTA